MVSDSLSLLSNNGDQHNTNESNYIMGTMSHIKDIEDISEGMFPINFKKIEKYQQKDPIPMDKI